MSLKTVQSLWRVPQSQPSAENARRSLEFRRYDGTTSWWPAVERRWRLCMPSRRPERNRQLDTAAQYRWGSDKSRWWFYTWRAQARQASKDCHASAASSRGRTSWYRSERGAATFITRCSMLLMIFRAQYENRWRHRTTVGGGRYRPTCSGIIMSRDRASTWFGGSWSRGSRMTVWQRVLWSCPRCSATRHFENVVLLVLMVLAVMSYHALQIK